MWAELPRATRRDCSHGGNGSVDIRWNVLITCRTCERFKGKPLLRVWKLRLRALIAPVLVSWRPWAYCSSVILYAACTTKSVTIDVENGQCVRFIFIIHKSYMLNVVEISTKTFCLYRFCLSKLGGILSGGGFCPGGFCPGNYVRGIMSGIHFHDIR